MLDNDQEAEDWTKKATELIEKITPYKNVFSVLFIFFSLLGFLFLFLLGIDSLWTQSLLSISGIILSIVIIIGTESIIFLMNTLIIVSLFLISITLLVISLLNKSFSDSYLFCTTPFDTILSTDSLRNELAIYVSIISAGTLGGLMQYLSARKTSNQKLELYGFMYHVMAGIFSSLILFLIFRAGLISQPSIDTFNIWGVAGISAMTGFFSDRMLKRISTIFDTFISNDVSHDTKNSTLSQSK